jgi:hypothetical protein
MSTRKLVRAIQHLFQQIGKLARTFTKGLVSWLLRGLLLVGRQPLMTRAGFVLPTTVLLLLVVTLTVGSIAFRTFTRTTDTIGERQQRVIYNAATPAIDRAKAKLEFMFDKNRDPRLPGGVPGQDQLMGMMLNDGRHSGVQPFPDDESYDPYTFPGEERLDLGGGTDTATNGDDNAWWYEADLNGDGDTTDPEDGVVAYSILFQEGTRQNTGNDATLANLLQVRHGPLSINSDSNSACATQNSQIGAPEGGWQRDEVNTSLLKKNFQVNALVLPRSKSGTVSTLEFHQDREVRSNKWGAWMRNDMEIFPGPTFNWNGAMHTEGSLIVGKPGSGTFTSYLISAPESCLFEIGNSVVTVTTIEEDADAGIPAFNGQFISGLVRDNNFGGNAVFHLQNDRTPITTGGNVAYNNNNDSTPDGGAKPAEYALDPIELQTRGNSKARMTATPPSLDPWLEDRSDLQNARLFAAQEVVPNVDDSFRADNRYGPKPKVDNNSIPGNIGDPIPATEAKLVAVEPFGGGGDEAVGLDGYWERRARREGLRLVVGQRLELGNAFGWNGPNNPSPVSGTFLAQEPLRPWAQCATNSAAICNEARQRRTLRDNLAAVQATAVYHSANPVPDGKDFPVACLATTVHHGTGLLLERSSTFEDLNFDLGYEKPGFPARTSEYLDSGLFPAGTVISDFFRGRGTNGWEYEPPSLANLQNPGSDLRKALRNLANFAGDPKGGAPSFTPVQDNVVHPYPSMAMWGDFSVLRRVLDLMDSGVSYDQLSPADKTTLHTAACTIGMLAYNVHYLYKYQPYFTNATAGLPRPQRVQRPELEELRAYIRRLWNTSALPPATSTDPRYNGKFAGVIPGVIDAAPKAISPTDLLRRNVLIGGGTNQTAPPPGLVTPEEVIGGLERWRDLTPSAQADDRKHLNKMIYMAQMIANKEQVWRDLRYGFEGSGNLRTSTLFGIECREFRTRAGGNLDIEPLYALCSTQPRYPALYALFANTDIPGVGIAEVPEKSRDAEDSTLANWSYITSVNNGAIVYQRIDTTDDAVMQGLSVRPRLPSQWLLPRVDAGAGQTPNSNQDVLIRECNRPCSDLSVSGSVPPPTAGAIDKRVRVAFKDSAPYNGRELMSVRTLDMNLELMRNTPFNGDFWLPKKGIIYAFREDAASESSIVRPRTPSGNWASCSTNAAITTANCRMNTGNVSAYASKDPPLNPENQISPKPVDYFPDPDRRPNGFRLRNGADLRRTDPDRLGMTLVSDNSVYIQGDFNLHRNAGGTRLEEFRTLLADDFSNFYQRSGLDNNFAREGDRWRPAEIVADAITILSANFCDGSAEDAFTTASQGGTATVPARIAVHYGCQGNPNVTSYLNQNRPRQNPAVGAKGNRWLREETRSGDIALTVNDSSNPDPTVGLDGGRTPILVNRQGNPVTSASTTTTPSSYTGTYFGMNELVPRAINVTPPQTRVNATIVSGLVPSRENQSYGGLHNFPRFLEKWENRALYISGSFIQLSFSNSAVGPFDQDAFEVGATPVGGGAAGEYINYYRPPNRYWGYDVGLQIAPAGPLAKRFVSLEPVRSEFYDEPPADDPYIKKLCAAIRSSVDPSANCTS